MACGLPLRASRLHVFPAATDGALTFERFSLLLTLASRLVPRSAGGVPAMHGAKRRPRVGIENVQPESVVSQPASCQP